MDGEHNEVEWLSEEEMLRLDVDTQALEYAALVCDTLGRGLGVAGGRQEGCWAC